MFAWTCEFCKDVLKSWGAVQQGNKKELSDRCALLKYLVVNRLDFLMSASKTRLKSVSDALSLPHRHGASKDAWLQIFQTSCLMRMETCQMECLFGLKKKRGMKLIFNLWANNY